jgi:hypothetical protein
MSTTVRKWANVAVAMQSAIAAAKTITAITEASPGVVSSTTHGYSNGDYVYLSVQGMYQVDGRVFRVSSVAADAFTLESEDTSDYEPFVSGFAYKLTFGTTLSSMASISASGGDFDFIDTSTIHANVKTQIPGSANPLSYSFDNLWDMSDTAQLAMKAASQAQAVRAFKFTFGTGGPIMTFAGYVGYAGAPTGQAQDKVTSPAVITCFGNPTYYAS